MKQFKAEWKHDITEGTPIGKIYHPSRTETIGHIITQHNALIDYLAEREAPLHHQLQKAREEATEEIIADYMEALGTVQLPKEVWLWIADINGKYLNKTLKENI